MPPETRLFLLITAPPGRFAPIGVTCAIIGNTNKMRGIESQFSGRKELKKQLEAAGLPEFEIARAVQRLKHNFPTFYEITVEIAEKLRLIRRLSNVPSKDAEGILYTTRHPSRIRSEAALSLPRERTSWHR